VPPETHHLLGDLATSVDPAVAVQHAFDSTSQWLSDAAAATADADGSSALADAAADKSWWQQWLNIFKITLAAVHSTIDGPLRSLGVEQTWGVSIFLFTASVRSLLVPLSIQQSKSSEYMKALKPYVADIREKFKDNEDMQNKAIGKLYQDAEQNPLAGCFVSLAQLPIFLGLYRGIRLLAMDGQIDEPFLWIPSLQGPVAPPDYRDLNWLTEGWTPALDGSSLPVPHLGWETTLAYLIMPVTLVLLQSFTMNALQPPADENMKEEEKEQMEKTQGILKFLPLMIGFFSLQVPAGLTIYWFTSNLFTLTQSVAVKAYYKANPPEIELPDYWKALDSQKDFDDMTPEERKEAVQAGIKVGPELEELVDDARFHIVLERKPLREESAAWQRVMAGSAATDLPADLQEWVAAADVIGSSSDGVTTAVQAETKNQTASHRLKERIQHCERARRLVCEGAGAKRARATIEAGLARST